MTTALLNQRFGGDSVSFVDGPDASPVVCISNDHAEAEIALYGGQVMRFQPRGEAPVLWVAAEFSQQPDTSLRGGVPVCFPWFARHHPGADSSVFPFHGFARISVWDVTDADASGVMLSLPPRDGFPLRAQLLVQVDASLSVRLAVENVGNESVPFSAALHPYIAVRDIHAVSIEGLAASTYFDQVNEMQSCRQQGSVCFDREVNRIYTGTTADCVIHDPLANRRVLLRKTGSRTTVVWNPGVKGITPDVTHFGGEEYCGFVCVEPANLCDDAVMLAAGESHTLGFELSIV